VRETGRNGFKARLIKELEHRFPGCIVFNLDPNTVHQGVPDLLILYRNTWAMLETKGAYNSRRRPNQEFYVNFYNEMSYANFIYPENEEEVLDDLQQTFQPRRRSRISKR
jgi:hypothetical protein